MRRLGLAVISTALLVAGCRGDLSEKPPRLLIRDMRNQPKYRPEASSAFFADGRAMRPEVEGTIARDEVVHDEAWRFGRTAEGFVRRAPIEVNRATLLRGQERFNIYCAACHDRAGSGRGMIVQRGYPPPIDLTSERVRDFADGQVFDVMSRGVRNMPSYAAQIPVEDRWAIVAWMRVLQRSAHAKLEDVPTEQRDRIEPEAP